MFGSRDVHLVAVGPQQGHRDGTDDVDISVVGLIDVEYVDAPREHSHGTDTKKTADESEVATVPQRFVDAARELGCDESEERFGELVQKLAKAGPQHKPTKAKPKKPSRPK